MQNPGLAWCLALTVLGFSCSGGSTDGNASICGVGTELCNGTCVAIGYCTSSLCATGQVLCDGVCVASGTCNSSACGTGYVLCSDSCVAGTSCSTNSTSTSTSTASSSSGGSGNSTSSSTGGVTATGGTTAYTDTNPSVCSDTSVFTMNATTQYRKSAIPLTNNPTKTYIASSNWWNSFTGQTVAFSGLSYTVSGSSSTSNDYPAGYPAFYIGSYQQTNSLGSNLPKLVSSISSIPTVFSTNVTSYGSGVNASIDVWFNTTADNLAESATSPTGGYLMVWLSDPSDRQPRGSQIASGETVGSVSGSWNVWSDGTCVSYVASSPINSLTFDLNEFIQHAVSNGRVIQSSWYLAVIFGGFEIWNGGSGAKVSNFCTKVN